MLWIQVIKRHHDWSSEVEMRVLVTGGAQGIGRAVCHKLEELGDEVISADLQEQDGGGAAEDPPRLCAAARRR